MRPAQATKKLMKRGFHMMNRLVITLVILCFLLMPGPFFAATDDHGAVYVAFRVDDYSSISDLESDIRIMEIFSEARVPVTIAAIPFAAGKPITGERADLLRDWVTAGIAEIAVHGYRHDNISDRPRMSEFVGRNLIEQTSLLAEGKLLLESIAGEVVIFVPPWNTYDINTIHALGSLGYEILSADIGGVAKEGSLIRFVPFTTFIHEFPEAIARARGLANSGLSVAVVLLIHAYEFTDGPATPEGLYGSPGAHSFEELKELLFWVTQQQDINISTIGEIAYSLPSANSQAYASQINLFRMYETKYGWMSDLRLRLLPAFLAIPLRDPLGGLLAYPLGTSDMASSFVPWNRVAVVIGGVMLPYILIWILTYSLALCTIRYVIMPSLHFGSLAGIAAFGLPWLTITMVIVSIIDSVGYIKAGVIVGSTALAAAIGLVLLYMFKIFHQASVKFQD
jgi:peptidoglycan/xylan/chitin deacetylase (PgdA/CDA1 family)